MIKTVKHITSREDYREYEADKTLHNALKVRDQVQRTHSVPRLIRMWADELSGKRVMKPERRDAVDRASVESPQEIPNG